MLRDLALEIWSYRSAEGRRSAPVRLQRCRSMLGGDGVKVYVANFGQENYAWPDCLARSEVVTMQDEAVHAFWRDGDRPGYIDYCVANLKTQKGIAPTRSVAGRWFNLGTIVTGSAGDLWLHQD